MIDTLALQFNLTYEGNSYVYNSLFKENAGILFPKSRRILYKGIYKFVGGIPPYSLYYYGNYSYIIVEVCPRVLLKRFPNEDDLEFIQDSMKSVVFDSLNVRKDFVKSITLNRIDYNKDEKGNDEILDIFYNLKSKATSQLNNVVKTEREYAISYTPVGGYAEVMTYDKYKQLLAVRYEDYYTVEELESFKGVIRTEVRIKNRKLNYYKHSDNWGLAKELSNYLNEDMKRYFWHNYVEKVWYTEPFYRVDIAMKMIRKNNSLTKYKKDVLCDVVRRINKFGYTRASEHFAYEKRWNKYEKEKNNGVPESVLEKILKGKLTTDDFTTFRTYIAEIRKLGINPLTFDKKFKLEKIENFAKYESSAVDD